MSGLPDIAMSETFREYVRSLRNSDYLDLEPADNQGFARPHTGYSSPT